MHACVYAWYSPCNKTNTPLRHVANTCYTTFVSVTMLTKANVICLFVYIQWKLLSPSFVYRRGLQVRSFHISWKAQAPWGHWLLLSPGLSKQFITGILTGFRLEKQRMRRKLSPLRSAAWMTEMEVGRVTVGPTGGQGVGDDGLNLIVFICPKPPPTPPPRWGRMTAARNAPRLAECWLSETKLPGTKAQTLCLHPKWTSFDGYNELEFFSLDLSVWIIVSKTAAPPFERSESVEELTSLWRKNKRSLTGEDPGCKKRASWRITNHHLCSVFTALSKEKAVLKRQ